MSSRLNTPKAFRTSLSVERLETRDVPSATVLDLTTTGSSGTINGAIFEQTAPVKGGVIQSIVRMQASGKAGVEQGFNTDARPLLFDEINNTNTRAQQLDTVTIVNVDGVNYREFLLDINQSKKSPLLSLDELRIYAAGAPNLSGYDSSTGLLAGHGALYDLDASGDSWVKLNDNLNGSKGVGDMMLLVPDANFAGVAAGSYVYLYSKFGVNIGASKGVEEWAVVRHGQAVAPPPPGTANIGGQVFDDTNGNGVLDPGEMGLGNATIQIQGTDPNGNAILLTAVTDPNGFYQFTNLPPGTYSVAQVATPYAYIGSLTNNYSNIYYPAGSNANDNFADIYTGS
jgi:hypothetical protein